MPEGEQELTALRMEIPADQVIAVLVRQIGELSTKLAVAEAELGVWRAQAQALAEAQVQGEGVA